MRFDWRRFCETNGLEYRENAPGTAKGNIYVDCPFCGGEGRGKHHMGLHLTSATWGCWRSGAHAGKSPQRLVIELLGCSWGVATEHVRDQDWVSDELGDLLKKVKGLDSSRETADVRLIPWQVPRDLFALVPGALQCDPFLDYLNRRGLPDEVAQFYGLMAARSGEFRWRVCLPFVVQGKIVGMTGRHIGASSLRYFTLPDGVTNNTVFNFDHAARLQGDALVIVEGPFDAIVLDWLFEVLGLNASVVALAGLGWSSAKRLAVLDLAHNYDRVILLLDRGAEGEALRIVDELRVCGVGAFARFIPDGVKDPAEFTAEHAAAVLL